MVWRRYPIYIYIYQYYYYYRWDMVWRPYPIYIYIYINIIIIIIDGIWCGDHTPSIYISILPLLDNSYIHYTFSF